MLGQATRDCMRIYDMKNREIRRFGHFGPMVDTGMIVQSSLPYDVFDTRRLPGVAPVADDPWFHVDEAYAAQMAHRVQLIATQPDAVIATDAPTRTALDEMLDEILVHLPQGFQRREQSVICPDGREVPLRRDRPFETLGHILQEDICLLEKRGAEHVLTGAVLCFPASWRLAEKIGQPLTHIHTPVSEYDATLARRVQRLFDGVRAGHPLWRFNALWYDDAELHQPRSASAPREQTDQSRAPFLRSERQVIWRLPESGGVLFTIHTYVVPREQVMMEHA